MEPNAPHPQSHAAAVHVLMRLMRRHRACIEARVRDSGIHPSQHRILSFLARHEHIFSQRELAEAMDISPAAVTTTLQKLEKDGYITRSAFDGDNRCKGIRITECGLAKVHECREIFEAVDSALFEGLSEEELRTLSALIRRMDVNLDAMGAPQDICSRAHCGKSLPAEEPKGGEDA